MNLLSPTGSRASFLRVVATVHLVLAVIVVGAFFWLDPTWISQAFTTFSNQGYTPGQQALLLMSIGSGGLHVVVAFSAVLVLVALSSGRAPAMRTRLLGVYLGIVVVFLVAKAVGLVVGVGMQLPVFVWHEVDAAGVITRVSGWRIVGTFLAQASLACIPAFAIVLSSLFKRLPTPPEGSRPLVRSQSAEPSTTP
jgi:hypothetical protein